MTSIQPRPGPYWTFEETFWKRVELLEFEKMRTAKEKKIEKWTNARVSSSRHLSSFCWCQTERHLSFEIRLYVIRIWTTLTVRAIVAQHFFAIEYLNFSFFSIFCIEFCIFFCEFFMFFFPDFAPNSRKQWRLSFFNQICENKLENCRKFWNLWKLFNIIQYYSFVSLVSSTGRRDGSSRP